MNISDFERLLRDGNAPREFPPEEHRWQELKRDLKKERRRGGVMAFPKWLPGALAASLLLLIFLGIYYRYAVQHTNDVSPLAGKETRPSLPRILRPASAPARLRPSGTSPAATALRGGKAPKQPAQTSVPAPALQTAPKQQLPPATDTAVMVSKDRESQQPEPPATGPQRRLPRIQDPQPEPDNTVRGLATAQKINLGVSALYGLSSVSKGQYRVSVDARRSLSGRLFASVQLIASAAKFETKAAYEYQVISVGPPGIGPPPATGMQQAEAIYSGSIYTLGFSPGIGFRLTKKIAVSAGPDLQKAVGGAISLRNKETFRNQFNNQSLIDEQQSVSALDFGLQSAAQVAVSRQLALTLLYRYGLTDYLKKEGGATRNSFLSIGLSYQFIR